MLAAPVSFEGRLEQYVGRLNRDYVGKEAVYVYDYIDSHVRYFDKMYAKRLRTYRKMGFSIWTQELQPKQIINAIFDSVNYTEKFEQDIVESEKMVVISSPDIRQDKIDRFLLLVKKRQEVGVKVTVITTDPEDITYAYVAIMLLCIGGFAHQALSGALITLSSDVFGRNEVATANGLTGMSAWLASTLFALVVGALADTIGFSPLFAVLAVFDLLGALVIWTVLQNKPAIEVAQETHNDPAPQH